MLALRSNRNLVNDPFERFFTVFDSATPVEREYQVYEDKDAWTYEFDMPGVSKEDVVVELTDRILTVEGKRQSNGKTQKEYHYRLSLPQGAQREGISAGLEHGVLRLRVPKSATLQLTIPVL